MNELRLGLFKKKQAQSERLPPTQGALSEAILRAHYQTMVCNNDNVPNPNIPSPENYWWKKDSNEWLPVMTTTPPAPEAIIEMVKCGSGKQQCSINRCQCQKGHWPNRTELCACSDEDESCENALQEDDGDEYIDDNDEKGNSYDNASDDIKAIHVFEIYVFIALLRGD